ncbi:MAG: cation-translocating P-type ATPase [Caldilineaceae bacterium]|nr:cation-translocating P-type ATPase [Caldilineaceae bacterium]
MIEKLRTWLEPSAEQRKRLVLISGLLIVMGLSAEWLLGWNEVRTTLLVAASIVAGYDIALRAWRALLNRHFSIELLVTIASTGALLIGEVWEAAAVTFLFMLGAYLEARTLSRTRQVLEELLDLAPATAVVLRDGEQVEVLAYEVGEGETVLVKGGMKVPVDGEVIAGRASVDESAITGESIPAEKESGASVFAGTINQDGLLTVRATGVGADTTLARIVRRVEEAQEEKAPAQRFMERFARWYTPAIIVLSVVAWLVSGDLALALTLLVIGCPGALVISMPVSIVAGIGRAAQRGILIKGGQYLEQAGKITALALDKTGTLTRGKPRVTDVIALDGAHLLAGEGITDPAPADSRWSDAERNLLYWAGIAESGAEHPLARAILAEARQVAQLPHPDAFDAHIGRGISAQIEGRTVIVGTSALMDEVGVSVSDDAAAKLERLKAAGKTAVFVAVDGQLIGLLALADTLREEAPEMMRRLRQAGVNHVVMLTGDSASTAQAIAAQVGISDVRAGLLPEEKLEAIRELQNSGHVVAMVGDGINDAPALALADIGIAMGAAGTDVAIETADVALMTDDLLRIPEAIALSKATMRNIRQNVIIALLTVGSLLTGVLLGQVHMAGGMFIHELSVLVVILNGMRLLRVGKKDEEKPVPNAPRQLLQPS